MVQKISQPSGIGRFALVFLTGLLLSACSSADQKAQSYYDHGQKLLAEHNTKGAALEFKNAIKAKKDFLPAYRGLAQIDESENQWSELAAVLHGIIDLDPQDVDSKLKLARLLLYANSTDQAQKIVADIDAPNNAKLLALKAAIAYRLKDTKTALADAQAAIKIDPTNIDAIMLLASERLGSGDPKGALAMLGAIPQAPQNDLGVALFKIKIFEQMGDMAQIEAQLKKLVELYPSEPAFRTELVKFYITQKRFDDAEKELRATITADPKNADAELDLVRFLYITKGPAAARAELTTRIGAGGDVFRYQMELADFDYSQGHYDDTSKLLVQLAADTSSSEHALAAKIRLAQFDLDRKDPAAASALIADILKADSRNAAALKLRATIEMDSDQLEAATNDLRTALNDQPRATDLMLLLATAYERSGSIELAEKQYADAMRASNYDARTGLSYVAFLQRRGSAQRAEDILTDLASRQPNNVQILSALAQVKLAHQDWAGAQEIGDRIKKIGNADGAADQILGAALSGEHKYDQSISALQNAVTEAPAAVQPMVALVRGFLQAKQPDKAIDFLQGVLKKNPADAEALVLLGSVQLANQAPDQAIKSFQAAIDKQPKDVIGYRALADLYLDQKNPAAAMNVIQAGLKQLPNNIVLHMSLAGIQEINGNYEGAISEYEFVLSQQPGSLIAANNLASMLSNHRTDKASLEKAQALVASLKKSPVPQFKDTIGWVSYRSGDYKAAVSILEEASVALPDVADVHYHLGMSYLAVGQPGKAAEQFKTALTKNPSIELADNIKAELKKTATQ